MSLNGAEWLARSLARSGQSHVFFIDAVLRPTLMHLQAQGVQPVLAHSEKGAAYMADGYARLSGRPGVVAAQSVGAANLAAALQDAWLGRAPMIALSGRKQPSAQHRNAYQEVPHGPLFAPVTRASMTVEAAADLPRLFRQAWSAATVAPPRPVHLDLNGLMGEVVEQGDTGHAEPGDFSEWNAPRHRPAADAAVLAALAERLSGAGKLAILAGDGAALSSCGEALLAVAERLQAPIATSLGARDLLPSRHPLNIGVVGSYSAPPANRILHDAEVVLLVGCDMGDQVTHAWRIPGPATTLLQIDADPLELDRCPAALSLQADPRTALEALLPLLGTAPRDPAYAEWAAQQIAGWRAAIAPRLASDEAPIDPARLCAEISAALPEDGVLVADTGYSGIWTGTLIEFNGTGQRYLRAAGSLGWAFPAALGAKCAAGDRKVVCYSGDGALYYHLTELETAKRRGIAITLVINNNQGFGQGWPNLLRAAGNKPELAGTLLRFGEHTDFCAIAAGFGLRGIRVDKPEDIAAALREAMESDETVVVEVMTGIDHRAPEPWAPETVA
ncbi:thiamine pyrophosphate-binding protein [Roseomonas sp. 18066]|uniref:thiamine pyrophosphate-binding protein n=1 Tax=Roseomonas sp. 18066 TaxID=2681412 RepID=UPI00135CA26F|nr:thiamine pyrophosphate-binding protein [Roseomonas sp. 18066]